MKRFSKIKSVIGSAFATGFLGLSVFTTKNSQASLSGEVLCNYHTDYWQRQAVMYNFFSSKDPYAVISDTLSQHIKIPVGVEKGRARLESYHTRETFEVTVSPKDFGIAKAVFIHVEKIAGSGPRYSKNATKFFVRNNNKGRFVTHELDFSSKQWHVGSDGERAANIHNVSCSYYPKP